MSSRWLDRIIDVAMSLGVLSTNGVVSYRLSVSGGGDLRTIFPPTAWDLGFLSTAFFVIVIAETEVPQAIRKSSALRRQARLMYYSALFLGVAYTLAAGNLAQVPNLIVVLVACAFALLSVILLARDCIRPQTA
jgi:hypothetical protein